MIHTAFKKTIWPCFCLLFLLFCPLLFSEEDEVSRLKYDIDLLESKVQEYWVLHPERELKNIYYTVGLRFHSGVELVGIDFKIKEPDLSVSNEYYLKAAKLGHLDAMYLLGGNYLAGKGAKQDLHKAFAWFSRGAAYQHSNSIGAMGYMQYWGLGVEQNKDRGKRLLRQASESGSSHASYLMGRVLFNEGKYSETTKYLEKGNDHLDAKWTYITGMLYLRQNKAARGVYWLKEAVLVLHPDSLFTLATMYFYGDLVPQSYIEAYIWANLALANKHEIKDQEKVEELEKIFRIVRNELPKEDLIAAQKISSRISNYNFLLIKKRKHKRTLEEFDYLVKETAFIKKHIQRDIMELAK